MSISEHTCNMGIKSGNAGIFVDKIESRDFGIKLFSEVGKNFPFHCTAMGKVLLAYAEAEETEKVISQPLQSYTDNTITQKEVLLKELKKVKILEDLKPFKLIQHRGDSWVQKSLLANNYDVHLVADYDTMFKLLAKGRGDGIAFEPYMSRYIIKNLVLSEHKMESI